MRDFSSSRLATALGSSVGSSPRSELLHCPAEAMRAEMLIDRSSDILYEEAVNDIDRDVYTCTAPWSASPPPHHDRTRSVMSRAVSDDAHYPLSQFLGYRSPTRGSIDRYASSDGVSLSSAVDSGPALEMRARRWQMWADAKRRVGEARRSPRIPCRCLARSLAVCDSQDWARLCTRGPNESVSAQEGFRPQKKLTIRYTRVSYLTEYI